MKPTGIIRRIDDLGRVVIPKELRIAQRIRSGDPMEIFTDDDGSVIFKKYNPDDLRFIAGGMARTFHKLTGYTTLVTNLDQVVAVVGGKHKLKELASHTLSDPFRDHMEAVRKEGLQYGKYVDISPLTGSGSVRAFLVAPFISDARDIYGSFCLLHTEEEPPAMSPEDFDRYLMAVAYVGDQFSE